MRPVTLKLLIGFYFLLVTLVLSAQDSNDLKTTFIRFDNLPVPQKKGRLPFKEIRIVDARFDTTKLGYFKLRSYYHRLATDTDRFQPLEQYLTRYFTEPADTSAESLVIILRSYWVHEFRAGEKYQDKYTDELRNISESIVRMEAYAVKNNQYQALIKMDTTFEDKLPLREVRSKMVVLPFEVMMENLGATDLPRLLKLRRKIPAEEIQNHYAANFEKPRIRNDELKEGVYFTFSDFLNNKITPCKIEVVNRERTDHLYIKENGEDKLLTEFWGYCDGKNHYIWLGNSLFALYRDGNTYSFWGFSQLVRNVTEQTAAGQAAMTLLLGLPTNKKKVEYRSIIRPMQLDMETGKAY